MISRSANSSSRKGSTASSVAGPPRFSITMPVLILRPGWSTDLGPGCGLGAPARLLARQPRFQREPGKTRDRADAELPHQALAMGLDGPMTDPERRGDLLVRPAPRDAPEHLLLPAGEGADGAGARLPLELPPYGGGQTA